MKLISTAKRTLGGLILCCTLAACSSPGPGAEGGLHDPYEAQNRKTHEFNRSLDKAIVRPASNGYVSVMPDELEDSVSNFADNLSLPNIVANKVLQGDLKGAVVNTVRFVVNTTLGFGGLFDPSSDFGVERDETDFGETLHKWGAKEGAYVELPVLGPSTERDAVGVVVDTIMDPMRAILPKKARRAGTVASIASRAGDRGRYSATVDGILYDSADSYAQARLIYLQNRRHELGQTSPEEEIDPFALDTEGF